MTADEFLEYAGKHYKDIKKKWTTRLKKQGLSFSEDIFQDTILKVYSHIEEYKGTDIDGYWYKSFLQNTRRDGDYSYHKRDDTIDVLAYLDNFPNEDPPILLSAIEDKLKSIDIIDRHLLIMYYLTDMSYMEIEELTGLKDVRYRLKKIVDKIRGYKKKGPQ